LPVQHIYKTQTTDEESSASEVWVIAMIFFTMTFIGILFLSAKKNS